MVKEVKKQITVRERTDLAYTIKSQAEKKMARGLSGNMVM